MTDVLAIPRGKVIKLADGNEYMMSPYNMNIMANLEEEFDCGLEKLGEKLTDRMFTTLRTILWVLLRDNYPDMTLQEAGKLVEMDQVGDVLKEIMSALNGLNT